MYVACVNLLAMIPSVPLEIVSILAALLLSLQTTCQHYLQACKPCCSQPSLLHEDLLVL